MDYNEVNYQNEVQKTNYISFITDTSNRSENFLNLTCTFCHVK